MVMSVTHMFGLGFQVYATENDPTHPTNLLFHSAGRATETIQIDVLCFNIEHCRSI